MASPALITQLLRSLTRTKHPAAELVEAAVIQGAFSILKSLERWFRRDQPPEILSRVGNPARSSLACGH